MTRPGFADRDASSSGNLFDELRGSEVVEVSLLLSHQQMLALEQVAHGRGLTAGEMMRQLLQDFIRGQDQARIRPLPSCCN
jgi:hypothetical protein